MFISRQHEKLTGAILFFLEQCELVATATPHTSWIYRYLVEIDFSSMREHNTPIIGINFEASETGLVPASPQLKISINDAVSKWTLMKKQPNKKRLEMARFRGFLSEESWKVMESVIQKILESQPDFARSCYEIKGPFTAWERAWRRAQKKKAAREPITMEDVFPDLSEEDGEFIY